MRLLSDTPGACFAKQQEEIKTCGLRNDVHETINTVVTVYGVSLIYGM
jgi:hypothetical protein